MNGSVVFQVAHVASSSAMFIGAAENQAVSVVWTDSKVIIYYIDVVINDASSRSEYLDW